jgi:nucleotide-binding universal stress UspA family protein
MSEGTVIVGVEPTRAEHADAIALGALLARLNDGRLLLVSVYEPRQAPWDYAGASHEHALRKAVACLEDRLLGLDVEQRVLPGASAARVLHGLADRRRTVAVVVGSSPKAPWGHIELGHVSERLLHGGAAPTVLAPRGYASRADGLRCIGVGYGGTPESDDAVRAAEALAEAAGAEVRVISVFDPSDYVHVMEAAEEGDDLRGYAQHALYDAVASVERTPATGELLDGDPAEVLSRLSVELDLLVLGSRSYGPLRAVLLGGTSTTLAHRAGCAVMVVPHHPDAEHEVTLVGGLEAPRGLGV